MSLTDDMANDLRSWGFVVGTRDPRLNTEYEGTFMVAEEYEESQLPTRDGRNGPWCIVGNDYPALVLCAYAIWSPDYLG